jgi:hypothetical protein
VDGFRLPAGSNTDEQLKTEVLGAKVLIGIISSSSLKSAYVTFELGARWGTGKPMIPLLVDVGPESLDGPLQGINSLNCKSPAQIYQFVDETAKYLGLSPDRVAAYQKHSGKHQGLPQNLFLELLTFSGNSPQGTLPRGASNGR